MVQTGVTYTPGFCLQKQIYQVLLHGALPETFALSENVQDHSICSSQTAMHSIISPFLTEIENL